MTDLNALTIAEARDKLRSGEITSKELTESCLAAADAASALNAVVHPTPDIALEQAKVADERLQGSDTSPSMCGIPLGIKDLFCTKGVASQAASGGSSFLAVRGAQIASSQRTLSSGDQPTSLR